MTRPFAIRRAVPSEAPAILDLMRRAFGEYRGLLQPESSVFVETVEVVAAKLCGGDGFIAVADAAIIGCVIAEAMDDRGYLGRLAVDPAARRQGIARALVAAAEDHVRRRGLTRIELNVRIAVSGNIALFQALGYREIARKAHPGWPHPTYLVMEKTLE